MNNGRKPTTTERGYGWTHQQERARWQRVVDEGRAICAKCGKAILPGQPWDLGHTDDRTAYTGPECVKCNRSDGAARGNCARINGIQPERHQSWEW
jgi:hypothetical protein